MMRDGKETTGWVSPLPVRALNAALDYGYPDTILPRGTVFIGAARRQLVRFLRGGQALAEKLGT